MSRIAIMQPYLLPYAGYFRLLIDVDAFVIADTQQFPRRGWVHRNRLIDDRAEFAWLTIPLRPQPLDTAIGDIAFAENGNLTVARNMARFAACRAANRATSPLLDLLRALHGSPMALIVQLLEQVTATLGIKTPMLLQSDIPMPAGLRVTEQIFAMCEALNAREYVNAAGGRDLYDRDEFSRQGLDLLFLTPYRGSYASILQRLADEPAADIRQEIMANLEVEKA